MVEFIDYRIGKTSAGRWVSHAFWGTARITLGDCRLPILLLRHAVPALQAKKLIRYAAWKPLGLLRGQGIQLAKAELGMAKKEVDHPATVA